MSLADEIAKVLSERPEIIASALESRPEVLYAVLAKLTPWDKLATKEDLKMLIELIDRRFEDVNRRFEDINKRFEDINKRFEDINKRFEDVNKRFEDMRYYVDRRFGFLEKLLVGFNAPILIGVVAALIRLLMMG